jgi:hypothetical protein
MSNACGIGNTLISGIVKLDERIYCMGYGREQAETEKASGEHDACFE